MFQKIRVQLVTLNAAVFLVLLLASGTALYLFLEHRLLDRVDSGLYDMQRAAIAQMPDRVVVRPNGRTVDMPMVTIVYDNQSGAVQQAPDSQFMNSDLEALRDLNISDVPQSIKLDGHTYRVLTALAPAVQVTRANPFLPGGIGVTDVQRTLQVVRNIDAEEDVLSTLLVVIVTGTLLGAALIVGAGFFLAGRALVPIRQAWERQQQFVADASHELRTPLAVVQSHSELMLRHPTDTVEEQSRNVAVVLKETKRMTKLVGDLLTLARTDSNQLLVEGRTFRLDEVVRDVAEDYGLMADVQEIVLHTQVDSCIEWEGDESRIRQLLVILLDNALRYTPEGGRIDVSCRQTGAGLELKVRDTGIGIAPADLPRIFDRFYRGDKARTRAEGGSGLGLSIAKWIVEAHHGKIRAESVLDQGTTLTVTLPAKR
jgi:signal transduction histidine kinase